MGDGRGSFLQPGRQKTGGRKKGSPNKHTAELKAIVFGALEDAGGREYMTRVANENPSAFLALLGKFVPAIIAGDPNNPIRIDSTLSLAQVPDELIVRYRAMLAEQAAKRLAIESVARAVDDDDALE